MGYASPHTANPMMPMQSRIPVAAAWISALQLLIAACSTTPAGDAPEPPLPGYPSDQKLIPFTVSELSGNRFYVDQESIDVDPDRDVRLTVVVDAPGGARTVTHEAIRCQTAEYKILAIGRRDRQWSVLADPQWRRIEEGGPNRQRAALALEYLCDGPTSVLDRDAALRALKASPRTKSFQKP